MLLKLTIDNYALIEHLEMEFGTSLNIITGETGAGKSILLGALGLLLGERTSAAIVRDGEGSCVVEGEFRIDGYGLEEFFEDNDLDYETTTTIRRIISAVGKSRAYINDLPVQLTVLKEFAENIIDIHSQHQSVMLNRDSFRVDTLDSVARQSERVAEYREKYDMLRTTERELTKLKEEAERSRKDEEWLRFQLEQLESVALNEEEYNKIEEQQRELANADEIKSTLISVSQELNGDGDSVLTMLKRIEQSLKSIEQSHQASRELSARLKSATIELRDIEQEIGADADRIEANPAKQQKLENKLDAIYSLQHKHNVSTVGELITIRDDFNSRLNLIVGEDQAIDGLTNRAAELRQQATTLARIIGEERKKAGVALSDYIEKELVDLGMEGSRFVVDISPSENLKPNGADDIRFLFSANQNTLPKPIEQIASGGEISRVMLALKSLVAQSAQLPTIIFDEIDAGVSGRIADAVGESIVAMSGSMQVINITHLPQVASKGDTHFYVYKEQSQSNIKKLSEEERIDEIAKMLSGSKITEAAIEQAKLLLNVK